MSPRTSAPEDTTGPTVGDPPSIDLAATRPGAHCLARAQLLATRAPLRSRIVRALGLSTREAAWRRAADGEQRVAVVLDRLGPDWRVLHSVPIGDDHPAISHLVIGPPGVFALLSRRHRGWYRYYPPTRVEARVQHDEILIEGESVPYMAQARTQAWRAARTLSAAMAGEIHVRPAVVLVGLEDIRYHGPPDRVEVLSRRLVLRWLNRFPPLLQPARVAAVHATARRGDVWLGRCLSEGRESE